MSCQADPDQTSQQTPPTGFEDMHTVMMSGCCWFWSGVVQWGQVIYWSLMVSCLLPSHYSWEWIFPHWYPWTTWLDRNSYCQLEMWSHLTDWRRLVNEPPTINLTFLVCRLFLTDRPQNSTVCVKLRPCHLEMTQFYRKRITFYGYVFSLPSVCTFESAKNKLQWFDSGTFQLRVQYPTSEPSHHPQNNAHRAARGCPGRAYLTYSLGTCTPLPQSFTPLCPGLSRLEACHVLAWAYSWLIPYNRC